ncbi:MAG: helix-turn-helix transcriptional regulator [Chloroflexi bacterium]|nr:helix-turn-helix transcriptional regulator [Chloroflexota bacterium]
MPRNFDKNIDTRKTIAENDCTRTIELMTQRRKELKYSRADVARLTGVNPNTIAKWEGGKNTPSIKNFFLWCDALNAVPDDVLAVGFGES